MKKIISLALIILILSFASYYLLKMSGDGKDNENSKKGATTTTSLCYKDFQKANFGYYDKTWLRMDINGEKVSGRFETLPAEKDSKVGDFVGTFGPLEQQKMGRTVNLLWNTFSEGVNTTEELIIEFGEGNAVAFFGAMAEREDGVIVYKDKNDIFPGRQLDQVACEDIDEAKTVEKYVKDNIIALANEQAPVGGTWHAVSVFVDYTANSGEVYYEDGHTRRLGIFKYELNESAQEVKVTSFESKVPEGF